MTDVAQALLGPEGRNAEVVFRRGSVTISLTCQRRMTDVQAAQSVVAEAGKNVRTIASCAVD